MVNLLFYNLLLCGARDVGKGLGRDELLRQDVVAIIHAIITQTLLLTSSLKKKAERRGECLSDLVRI
jgi:hypothetical protein